MREIDSCYFVTTPFQLMTTIILCCDKKEKADLYVVPIFDKFREFTERVESLKIFDKVVIINDVDIVKKYGITSSNMRIRKVQVAFSYLFNDAMAREILIPNTEYKNMYVSSRTHMGRIVQLYFHKNKIPVKLFYFDDGEGSYDNVEKLLTPSKPDRIIRTILFGKDSVLPDHTKVLYSPKFYNELNDPNEYVESVPLGWKDEKIRDYINYVFGVTKDSIIKEQIIILDVIKEEYFDKENSELLIDIYKKITDIFTGSDVIIKRHPRDNSEPLSICSQYKDYGIPFEAICINLDMNSKVLITPSSTSVLLPKLLFDQEPYVIVLYKLLSYKTSTEERKVKQDKLFSLLKASYRNKEKFLIPTSIEELSEMLNNMKVK